MLRRENAATFDGASKVYFGGRIRLGPRSDRQVMRDAGIQVCVIETDDDYVKLRVLASNGIFTGQADVYETCESVREFARSLRGFPTSFHDTRMLKLGAFVGTSNEGHASGGAGFRFYCVDSAGHAAVGLRLRNKADPERVRVELAEFQISVEAAAIDSFIVQLLRMAADVEHAANVGQVARLEAASC